MENYLRSDRLTISAAQCRAARALLDWSQNKLAENAGVARATIADFERNQRTPMRQNLIAIRSCLQVAGLAFIAEEHGGAGVRFQKVALEYSRALRPDGRYRHSRALSRSALCCCDPASGQQLSGWNTLPNGGGTGASSCKPPSGLPNGGSIYA